MEQPLWLRDVLLLLALFFSLINLNIHLPDDSGNLYLCPGVLKNMFTKIFVQEFSLKSFTHNSPKLEPAQVCINRKMTYTIVYLYTGNLISNKKVQTTDTCGNKNKSQVFSCL